MKLNELSVLLAKQENKPFKLLLPGGGEVPQSFHVTEVGYVKKQFLDCGDHYHQSNIVQLQAWVGEDPEHRLLAGKLMRIIARASENILPQDAGEFPVEIEYENLELTQFRIHDYAIAEDAVVLNLEAKHTDCLAKDRCLPKPGRADAALCCGGGKC